MNRQDFIWCATGFAMGAASVLLAWAFRLTRDLRTMRTLRRQYAEITKEVEALDRQLGRAQEELRVRRQIDNEATQELQAQEIRQIAQRAAHAEGRSGLRPLGTRAASIEIQPGPIEIHRSEEGGPRRLNELLSDILRRHTTSDQGEGLPWGAAYSRLRQETAQEQGVRLHQAAISIQASEDARIHEALDKCGAEENHEAAKSRYDRDEPV